MTASRPIARESYVRIPAQIKKARKGASGDYGDVGALLAAPRLPR
jgi:hypothetical protein